MAAELVDRLVNLVAARPSPCMGATDSRSLRFDIYDRMRHSFVDELMFTFDGFLGMCGEDSCNVLMLLFMVLRVLIFAKLCRRAVMTQCHAFPIHGLRVGGFSLLFSF
jgi:hypothetical protein